MSISKGHKIGVAVLMASVMIYAAIVHDTAELENATINFGFFVTPDGFSGKGNYAIYDKAERAAAEAGITLTYTSGIMRDDYREWLATGFVGGNEPDVFLLFADDLPLYAKAGALYELPDKFLTAVKAKINSRQINFHEYDGKIYALSFYEPTASKKDSAYNDRQTSEVFIVVNARTNNRERTLSFVSKMIERDDNEAQ